MKPLLLILILGIEVFGYHTHHSCGSHNCFTIKHAKWTEDAFFKNVDQGFSICGDEHKTRKIIGALRGSENVEYMLNDPFEICLDHYSRVKRLYVNGDSVTKTEVGNNIKGKIVGIAPGRVEIRIFYVNQIEKCLLKEGNKRHYWSDCSPSVNQIPVTWLIDEYYVRIQSTERSQEN